MRKVALFIGALTLVALWGVFPILALTFGKLPHQSLDENQEGNMQARDIPAAMPDNDQLKDIIAKSLTLEQCIAIAKQRATEIRTAKLNLIQQDMNVKDAYSAYLPQITTNGSYQFSDNVDFGWEKENYSASVSARYTIWDHGRREGTLAQVKSGRDAQYSQYKQTGQALVYSVIRAYYDLLKAERLISINEQLLEQSKENVRKVETFVEVGIAIESDIATARVQQANYELSIINDQINVSLAKADLAVIMGMPPDTPIEIEDAPDYEQYMQTGLLETDDTIMVDAVSRALDSRPELEAMKANLAALEWGVTLAQLDRWPRISADCGYDLYISDYLRERDAIKNHKGWNVSAAASYPIFDGGQTRRTLQKADIALLKMKESAIDLQRGIALEVHQAYLSLERAEKSLDITRVQVEDARMSLEVAQGRYEQEMIILLELLDAQTRYASSITNQVEAFYNYKVAKGALEKAMGVLQ